MSLWTVSGALDSASITGPVLPHEHLAVDLRTDTDTAGYLADSEAVTQELAEARETHGLSLVVDQTCRGMGRNVNDLARIAAQSGVAVVASTGWYYHRFHPAGEPGTDVAAAADLLIRDLTVGIDATGIRAGVVGEIGTHDKEPDPAEEISLRAAVRAASACGVSVSTHAHLGQGALAQLRVLEDAGADMTRVCIGHQDLASDTAQHEAIASTGAYVAFDTVGKESYQSDDIRLRLLLAMLERGLERHVLLSNDVSRRAYLVSRGGFGYGHVLGPFQDRLVEAGVDDTTIDLLYRRNPIRWLTGESADSPSKDAR